MNKKMMNGNYCKCDCHKGKPANCTLCMSNGKEHIDGTIDWEDRFDSEFIVDYENNDDEDGRFFSSINNVPTPKEVKIFISALLTSEVENERERLLKEVEQFWLDNEFTPSYEDWEKKRKALSDIGGGK